ncbi:tyrosine-protein kinase STYK1 isoform X2 [Xiphias gladius]|uniref:tyrosine-protein kinase STYK1 isoform X2 n=1 Tax=Xiphias gladius TaxID=8245 RepID=UPI001A988351|nr:tyrosine-protein kinase STYK1 isoform X2 [Xiphias gladius]
MFNHTPRRPNPPPQWHCDGPVPSPLLHSLRLTQVYTVTRCAEPGPSLTRCSGEASPGPLAVVIIPCLLALGTVSVVALIFYSLHKNQRRAGRASSQLANGQRRPPPTAASVSAPKAQRALRPWEIPEECVLEGLQWWRTGRYGPVYKGLLRRRDGPSSAVVVKSLRDGPNHPEAKEFVEWLLFHAAVCKHENVVQMLHCQTERPPMYLVLSACSPGNLLHFLWTLRNNPNTADPLQNFSERSVFLVAKQVAAGLDYLVSEHRLVHGDVAARNILIGPGLSARVSGLGAAFGGRAADSAIRRRAAEVPLKWQAPERIMMRLSIDRSDVWSFGILLYELVTLGSPPYPELEPLSVLPKLRGYYRMKRPGNCGTHLYDLMKYCWMWSFKDRPAFSAVAKLLESSLHLAAVKPLHVPEVIDLLEYSRKAGLLP